MTALGAAVAPSATCGDDGNSTGAGDALLTDHLFDKDDEGLPLPYPSTADDRFEMKLIEAVEVNPCVYNRAHPLHKMADYKNQVWQMIADQTTFEGPPVELERKWRHMRDRYVRLRKHDKLITPIRKDDRWYYYYKKMSFLDPFVEHRNRKKRSDSGDVHAQNGLLRIEDKGVITVPKVEHIDSDSGEDEDLQKLYATFMTNAVASVAPTSPETSTEGYSPLTTTTSAAPSTVATTTATASTMTSLKNKSVAKAVTTTMTTTATPSSSTSTSKKRKLDDSGSDGDEEDTEVSLFVRSISKSLEAMDARTFALARFEISRVLFDCQYGKNK